MCENEIWFFWFDHVQNNRHLQTADYNPYFYYVRRFFFMIVFCFVCLILLYVRLSMALNEKAPSNWCEHVLFSSFCCVCNLIIAMAIYNAFHWPNTGVSIHRNSNTVLLSFRLLWRFEGAFLFSILINCACNTM